MAAATALAAGAVGVSAYSSYKQGKAQEKAAKRAADAAAYKPFKIGGLSTGNVNVYQDPETGVWNANLQGGNSFLSGIEQQLGDRLSMSRMSGPAALALNRNREASIAGMGGLIGQSAELGYGRGERGLAGLENAVLSNNVLNRIMQGDAARASRQALRGMSPGELQSNMLFQRGGQLLSQDYSQLADQRLDLLRQQAAPQEQRAAADFQNNLYKFGLLNNSTSSGILAEGFARGQAQADVDRQIAAGNFADQQRANDMRIGQALTGQSLQGLISGFGANTSRYSNLAQNVDRFGSSIYDQTGGLMRSMYNADEARINNANRRIALNERLFNFGQNVQNADINTMGGLQGLLAAIEGERRATLQASNAFSSGQAMAGANQAEFLANSGNTAGWGAIGDLSNSFAGFASDNGAFDKLEGFFKG